MHRILISTSKFGTAIPNYFKFLGEECRKNNFSVIYVFDGQIKNILLCQIITLRIKEILIF